MKTLLKHLGLLALLFSIVIGMFMRVYQYKERFQYGHDNDLAGWIVKDILIDHHLRLIGQLTTAPGIFIGPLFYYSLIPLYLFAHWDPLGTVAYAWGIGLFSITSIYFVVSKVFSKKAAIIATVIYSSSFLISSVEREIVPTSTVFLWTIWFLYSLFLLKKGHKFGPILVAVLASLVWHISLSLGLLLPLAVITFLVYRKYSLADLLIPLITFLVLSSPLLAFESRHHFSQTRALISSLNGTAVYSAPSVATTLYDKVSRVLHLAVKTATKVFGDFHITVLVQYYYIPAALLIGLLFLFISKRLSTYYFVLFLIWIVISLAFFVASKINPSEYYLNTITVLWIIFAALIISTLPNLLVGLFLALFAFYNLSLFLHSPINRNGYLDRTNIVSYIARDAKTHGFPCIAVSYMVDPGNDFGYRYFFWRQNLHVNQPSSESPVYTIVFPHGRANHLDYTSGGLGLVLPDYSRYTQKGIATSCAGENANLTDPMLGFTR